MKNGFRSYQIYTTNANDNCKLLQLKSGINKIRFWYFSMCWCYKTEYSNVVAYVKSRYNKMEQYKRKICLNC